VLANPTALDISRKQLLRVSQSGAPDAWSARDRVAEVFGDKLKGLIDHTCRRYCLHHQEREDVLGETYQQIFNPAIVRFAACRGEPEHYFKGLVQNAARKIMAQLGVRRQRGILSGGRSQGGQHKGDAEDASVIVSWYRMTTATLSPANEAELRDTVRHVLDHAPPRVRLALELCHWEGWSHQRIAQHIGISRFALAREIQRYFNKIKTDFV
jgi:RNA polymerase sigma factor (sigma-70 family)